VIGSQKAEHFLMICAFRSNHIFWGGHGIWERKMLFHVGPQYARTKYFVDEQCLPNPQAGLDKRLF
jgi:hypothetical protein